METYALLLDTPVKIVGAGPAVVIGNHPELDYTRTGFTSAAFLQQSSAAYVLVGFDRTPTAQAYDAIVPPFSEATIMVPETVRNLSLLWTSEANANVFLATGLGPGPATLKLQVSWSSCPLRSGIRPLDIFPGMGLSAFAYTAFVDGNGGVWEPSKWTSVLDQVLGPQSIRRPALRPLIAPSMPITKTGVLVANTLTTLTGVTPGTLKPGTVLKRLVISASAAGLVVVGTFNLTVASVSPAEVARVNFAAATPAPVVIDFGEGLGLDWDQSGGTWKYYASTAITVDITAILG